eukprot:7390188-Prymnesium_polylepis.1
MRGSCAPLTRPPRASSRASTRSSSAPTTQSSGVPSSRLPGGSCRCPAWAARTRRSPSHTPTCRLTLCLASRRASRQRRTACERRVVWWRGCGKEWCAAHAWRSIR